MRLPTCDVAVVGAGPAGLAAAVASASLGLATVVFDGAAAPGGQIYRAITMSPGHRCILGPDYWRGEPLVRAFLACGADYRPSSTVWAIRRRADAMHEIAVHGASAAPADGGLHLARAVILATGAMERPFPFPGWTLPGVFTAGGLQALMKSSALVPAGRVIFAGCGPLLWLAAWQALRAGAAIDCLLETVPRRRLAQAWRHAPEFLSSGYFGRGLAIVREVRQNVRVIEHVDAIEAVGDARVAGVRFGRDGARHEREAATLVVSQGVVPELAAASAAGCRLRWNDAHACFQPRVDAFGGSSVEGMWIAGDGAGIAGAEAAAAGGTLAALAAANALGRIGAAQRDRAAVRPQRARAWALRGRSFLDAWYRPAEAWRRPHGDIVICRCEGATARDVRQAARETDGAIGEVKARTRCGMGRCQGRMCALTLAELCADVRGESPRDVGYPRARFPLQPVPLSELARWPAAASEEGAPAVE